MTAAVVDANVLIGYKDTGAVERNQRADAIVRAVDHGDLPTCRVPDPVLLESLNWIHERRRHDIAVDLRRRLSASAGFELASTAKKDLRRAIELFDRHGTLSFGDAAIVAYMERTDAEYLYSFDDDFDRIEGVTRLATPENPFE
jgi:predicted nucleic acid-binding protein